MIVVPADFAATTVRREGEAGHRWIDSLPGLVAALAERWGLTLDGTPLHGYLGVVVPVRRGNDLLALKVSWPDGSAAEEAIVLRTWNGQGAVRLLEAEPALGALLLERLDSRRSLFDLGLDEAVAVAGRLLRRLAVPASEGLPRLSAVSERIAATLPERWEQTGHPMPRRIVDIARDLAVQLGASAGDLLVDWDLHYGNVLAAEREPWLVIDPKVVVGDPEYGVAQLLWTRLDEMDGRDDLLRVLQSLVDQARLDPDRARSWALVRCVDYWLWGLGVGLTEDPARCEQIVDWLS